LIEFINNYVIPGLVLGSIYALGAIGVSMIYSILRFAHFAHGDLMTFGAYVAFAVVVAFGWPPVAAMPLALVGTVATALVIDRFAYRPFRKSRPIVVVIASFGVALMIRAAIMLIWGVQPLGTTARRAPRRSPTTAPRRRSSPVSPSPGPTPASCCAERFVYRLRKPALLKLKPSAFGCITASRSPSGKEGETCSGNGRGRCCLR